jgi:hypothetical protein
MMNKLTSDNQVVCAVTGESIQRADAIEVGLFFRDGSSQGLFVKKEVLVKLLHESIPRHPELLLRK